MTVDLPRVDLIRMVDELKPLQPQLSFFTRTWLLKTLVGIIDQMKPKRDKRVNVSVWQLAMIARLLVTKRRLPVKAAISTAITVFAPSEVNNLKFHGRVSRTYSKLQGGKNPARGLLFPPKSKDFFPLIDEVMENRRKLGLQSFR